MVHPAEPDLTRGRRVVARLTLGGLAVSQGAIGLWALIAPAHFYATFPSTAHAWVALLPPYNEHLVRDVGALSLALTVLLTTAALMPTRLLVRTAVVAFVAYTVPHTLFHGLHLEGFPNADAVAQMTGFGVQLLAAAVALWAVAPARGPA